MSTKSQPAVRQIGDNEKPLMVDATSVGCGFLLFPKTMAGILQESHVHEALQTNKTKLWEAVRRHNSRIPVYLMTTNQEIGPGDAVVALDQVGKYPGYSIALDPMQMSPDGGRTFVTIYVGFNWKSSNQEVIVAGPQKILPGKPEFSGKKKWWRLW
jgi:hypothetical protein